MLKFEKIPQAFAKLNLVQAQQNLVNTLSVHRRTSDIYLFFFFFSLEPLIHAI